MLSPRTISPSTMLWPPSQIIMCNVVPMRHFLTRTTLAHARSEISMLVSNEILLSDFAQPDASGSVRNHYAALCFVRYSICVLARHRPSQGCNSTEHTRGAPKRTTTDDHRTHELARVHGAAAFTAVRPYREHKREPKQPYHNGLITRLSESPRSLRLCSRTQTCGTL